MAGNTAYMQSPIDLNSTRKVPGWNGRAARKTKVQYRRLGNAPPAEARRDAKALKESSMEETLYNHAVERIIANKVIYDRRRRILQAGEMQPPADDRHDRPKSFSPSSPNCGEDAHDASEILP